MPIPSNDYDVGQAFKRIEEELIASMMKNMKRHTDWETDEGFQWEMWQALQLQALEKYRKENPEKFKEEFEEINKMIPEAIKSAREHGQMDQEIEILEAIKKGWKPPELDEGLSGAFFRLNDRKLNALIEATTGDFEKAEAAILRKANDNYRKIIFNAQMYANTGAATYEKAVDMATKDFLAAGINCIEYKNGSRHTLEDYCDMALRTAQKRAYLAGEGEKRQEWGIHTVIMNKRGQGQPCPLCLPFVGKIMIDDVYGGGSKKDGPYKLLSEAMAAGLYHPRCRDSHTAYFPDIDEEEKLTREEVKKTKEDYKVEEEANYCSRQEEKYGRLAEHSLDPDNRRKYAARRDAWGEKAEQLQIETEKKTNEPTITAEMQETVDSALEYYVSGDGMYINKWLRDPEGFRKAGGRWTDHDSEFLAAMDVGTQDVVTEKVLYRSVDASAVFGDMTVAEWEEMTDYLLYGEAAVPKVKASAIRKRLDVKGKEITEPGFMSTTKDRELAMDWEDFTGSEKPIVLELDVPEGIRGKDMAKFEIEGDEQFEVLLARGQRYEVTEVRIEKGTVVVRCKLEPPSAPPAAIKLPGKISGIIQKPKSKKSKQNYNTYETMHVFSDGSTDPASLAREAIVYENEDGIKVIIPKDMDPQKQTMTVEQLFEAYDSVPEGLKVRGQKIFEIVDFYNPKDSYWNSKYRGIPHTYATSDDERITFWRHEQPHQIDYVTGIICHEIGHHIDTILGIDGKKYSERMINGWIKAMNADTINSNNGYLIQRTGLCYGLRAVTKYGANDIIEDFADSVKLFAQDKESFKRDFPNRARIIEIILLRTKVQRF